MTGGPLAGLRVAIGVALFLVVAAVMRLPQPFLGVIAICVLTAGRCSGHPGAACAPLHQVLAAAWTGAFLGCGVLILFPQQPWFSLPLAGACAGAGLVFFHKRASPVVGAIFLVGLASSFAEGAAQISRDALISAVAHGFNLTLAGLFVSFVCSGFPDPATKCSGPIPASPPWRSPGPVDQLIGWSAALALGLTLLTGALLLPQLMVPMAVATAFTIALAGNAPGPSLREASMRLVGAIVGAALSVVFLILLSGSGNSFVLLLAGLCGMLGILSALALSGSLHAPLFSQACSVTAVVATAMPAPPTNVVAAMERAAAVLIGFLIAESLATLRNHKRTSQGPSRHEERRTAPGTMGNPRRNSAA